MSSDAPTIPAYFQIARQIESRIYYGFYGPGTLIPSAKELSEIFKVSPLTVRQALKQLVAQKLLESRQGTGTFVALDPPSVRPAFFLGYLDDLVLETRAAETRILDSEVVTAPNSVCDQLGRARGASILRVRRVASSADTPLRLTTMYLPAEMAATLLPERLVERSIIQALNEIGCTVRVAHQTIGVGVAGSDSAFVLGVAEGSPVMICTFTMLAKDEAVAFLRTVYRGSESMYTATLVGPASVLHPEP